MDTGVIESESESDTIKRLKRLLKNPKKYPISSLQYAFQLKQETEEVNKAIYSITLNDISEFKNLMKAGTTIVCERVRISKNHSAKDPLRVIFQD